MKHIIHQLSVNKPLTYEQSKQVIQNMAKGVYNEYEISAFVTTYIMRTITLEELSGFKDSLLELCVPVDLSAHNPTDLCGTGGDEKNTFNISTLTSFVVAGAGYKVAKHGNYGVSSGCGSSNIIEQLGYQHTTDSVKLNADLERANICYLHAQKFHPAMKNAGPIRKGLGIKTFFNMLGPMVNPSFIKKQMVGVYSKEVFRLYNYLYQKTDINYAIVHDLNGYDEISLTGKVKIATPQGERLLNPEDFGFKKVLPHEIKGGESVEESFRLFMTILSGKGTESQTNVVLANAAIAIQLNESSFSILDAVSIAKSSLLNGKALEAAQKLVS